jgi:hypothetical protein
VKTFFLGVLVAYFILYNLLLIRGTVANRGRVRKLESRLDVTLGEFDRLNMEFQGFIGEIEHGIESLKENITGRAGTLTERIRRIVKQVELMENHIAYYRTLLDSHSFLNDYNELIRNGRIDDYDELIDSKLTGESENVNIEAVQEE